MDPGDGGFEAGVILEARVSGHDSEYCMTRLDHHGQRIVIPGIDLAVGDHVRLRIRARDVALALAKPSDISVRNILAGTVLDTAQNPDAAFAEVLVDVGGGRLRARITRDALRDLGLVVGSYVYALVKSISFDRPRDRAGRTHRFRRDETTSVTMAVQVLRIVADLPSLGFTAKDTYRILVRLGFVILEDRVPVPVLGGTLASKSDEAFSMSDAKAADQDGREVRRLLVVFQTDEDGWEVASCPTLSGCHSQGRTREEALDNIREAIKGYLASLREHDIALPRSSEFQTIEVRV